MNLEVVPTKYRHFYLSEIPERHKTRLEVRRCLPGERNYRWGGTSVEFGFGT